MTKALQIPEILINIGSHLSRKGLLSSVHVCKTWYCSLQPLVWRRFILRDQDITNNIIISQTIPRNGDFIQELDLNTVHELIWEHTQHFTRLNTLRLNFRCKGDSIGLAHSIALDLIQRNQATLQTIVVHCVLNPILDLLQALLNCPLLHTLELTNVEFPEDTEDAFCMMTRRLKRLGLYNCRFEHLLLPNVAFPNLEHLFLGISNYPTPWGVEIARHCPNLITLSVTTESTSCVRTIHQNILPQCRQLSTFILNYTKRDMANKILALKALPPIKHVNLQEWTIRPLDHRQKYLRYLRRHFQTLETIDLRLCDWVRSKAVQEILCLCPHLRSFKADEISGTDIERGKPWNCLGLEVLCLAIVDVEVTDSKVWTPRPSIYHQLMRLKRLESLHLITSSLSGFEETCDRLDFRLGYGLERLEPLWRLKSLRIKQAPQELSEQDIEWMVQTWPCLLEIRGRLHIDNEKNLNLQRVLELRGIQTDLVRSPRI